MEEEEGLGGRVGLICSVGLGANVAPLIRRLEQSCWDRGRLNSGLTGHLVPYSFPSNVEVTKTSPRKGQRSE